MVYQSLVRPFNLELLIRPVLKVKFSGSTRETNSTGAPSIITRQRWAGEGSFPQLFLVALYTLSGGTEVIDKDLSLIYHGEVG